MEDEPSGTGTPSPLVPEPASPAAEPRPPGRALRVRDLVLAAGAMAAGALVVFAILAARAGTSSVGVELSAEEPPDGHVAAPADEAEAVIGKWTGDQARVWTAGQRDATAFEVRAEKAVDVWMRTVQPVLVVRCVAGTVEAFVFTDSAAKMEPDTPDHTVTFRVDDGEGTTEGWPDAEAHDALFAPDGLAFTRRLTGARRLTFGFTPHNAPPVSAEFLVGGLPELMAGARPCSAKR